ncbi:MAG: TonB-dependent receptor plug domain-containing protein, partial [Pseudomonadales bacterium]|nr:TonB-dependent receptor plug domain-containing protein [Pseudomonadales bacterium]
MNVNRFKFAKLATAISILVLGSAPALAEQEMEEIVVKGSLGSLPGEDIESVFGFNKSILNTPRSVSTISSEIMERFNMQDIDELIVLAPGTFTQSFFGVAGGLDVRGTPGETYFRGVRRLDNPGNYPTPLGASDRIDIVRGPASPIYGPSKIGGYLNFNPKSARVASTGQFIDEPKGALSYTAGSWNKSVLTAEVGGPTKLAGQDMGYYFYAELESSGSYYDNTETDQTLVQVSFDMDISDKLRIQFGGMYHEYDGNQIAGWNRLTQELIDSGTYITGSAQPLDTDGDGSISHQEYNAVGLFRFRFDFLNADPSLTPGNPESLADLQVLVGDTSDLRLNNVGTTKLDGSNVLVAADDQLANEVTTLYFDVIFTADNGWEFKNQMFYEAYENINENAYGFSQFHDSWVFEDKLIISKTFETDGLTTAVQISPSIRYTDFKHGDDFTNEHFNRRDLTGPSTALDRRLLATRIGRDFDNYDTGDYLDLGIAALVDFTWESGFSALLGVRYDTIDIESKSDGTRLLFSAPVVKESEDVSGTSWTVSLSYEMAEGKFIPYFTAAEQATIIAGQGAEIGVGTIQSGGAFDTSDLQEIGVKGSLLDNKLYYAISAYKQERTDFSAQSIVTNQATETEGLEVELRWVVNDNLLVTFGYSHIEVTNLNTLDAGNRFSFIGADDLPNIDPSELFGGTLGGLVSAGPSKGLRAGMPEEIFSVTATYDFNNGLAVSASVVDVESVASGFSNSVILPAYTLVNLGLNYETENWIFSVNGKNLTDERYFRANFPNLFGSQIVLPELPRH